MAGRGTRRRWPLRLLVTVVVVAALLFGADYAARQVAQDQLAAHIRQSTSASSASATIHSFPFVYDVLAHGSVTKVDATADGVPAGPLRLQQVTVSAHQVQIDRHQLVADHRIHVTAIARATATVTVTAAPISAVAGAPVSLSSGNVVSAAVHGVTVPAVIGVEGQTLTLSAAGVRLLSVDLKQSPVVPACAMTLVVRPGELQVSCTVAPVPPSVIAALSQ